MSLSSAVTDPPGEKASPKPGGRNDRYVEEPDVRAPTICFVAVPRLIRATPCDCATSPATAVNAPTQCNRLRPSEYDAEGSPGRAVGALGKAMPRGCGR